MRSLGIAVAGVSLVAGLAGCQPEHLDLSTTTSNLVTSPTPTVTFPTTTVGASSAPIEIQLNPGGSSSTNVIMSITESCPDFSVQATLPQTAYKTCEPSDPYLRTSASAQPVSLPRASSSLPRASFQALCGPGSETVAAYFTATFSPTAPVASSCALTVNYTSNGNPATYSITLNGTGTPPPVAGDAIPATTQFGDVRVNSTSSDATVTLRNTGGAALSVTGVSTAAPFSIVAGTTTAFSLAAGATRSYSVRCAPGPTPGLQTGTFSVTSSNFSTITTALRCTGVDSNLDISPSPSQIPTTRVGEALSTTITLTNTGGAPMAITNVELTSDDPTAQIELMAIPPGGTMLAATGGSTTAQVRFMAQTAGEANATLSITYDNGQVRTSQISARALATSMSVSPSGSVDLGPVCIGQSLSKSFNVVGNSDGPFIVEDVGIPAGTFTLTAAGLPAAVQGNGGTTYSFEVAAAPTVEGPEVGTVTLMTDIPGAEDSRIDVSVTGLPEGVTGTPAELSIGATDIGNTTLAQYVTLTNCGTDPVEVTNPRIEENLDLEFAIVVPPTSLTIPQQGSISWGIVVSPKAVGQRNASFSVNNGDEVITIPLIGDGLGETEGGGADDGTPSYYACSTGGGAMGAFPLVLALGFAYRRRRPASRAPSP